MIGTAEDHHSSPMKVARSKFKRQGGHFIAINPIRAGYAAIGIRHPRITRRAQGFMGGSFNMREFVHGHGAPLLRTVKWHLLYATFALPALMLAVGSPTWLAAAFIIQSACLLAERWFFFAQANHPQNLYYQVIS
jgi:hypothetical protein